MLQSVKSKNIDRNFPHILRNPSKKDENLRKIYINFRIKMCKVEMDGHLVLSHILVQHLKLLHFENDLMLRKRSQGLNHLKYIYNSSQVNCSIKMDGL